MKTVRSLNLKKGHLLSVLNKNTKFNFGLKDFVKGKIDALYQGNSYFKNPAILDSNIAMYSQMRHFQAYLTKNAYDMSIFNEYDVWPHVNFGTIDNPVLIFGAGTTWRMVCCSGPASDEESSSHEKMYMIVREGPIHRCLFCGQCFKLVKLKDDVSSEENMYYSSVFTQISDHEIGEMQDISFFYVYTKADPRDFSFNVIPRDRVYAFVNSDTADHIMVDPAYRMQFYKNIHEDYYKKCRTAFEIQRQAELAGIDVENKISMPKDTYEIWFKIQKEILRFDRIYNRYEKFLGRKLFDPLNHERRENRMLLRQKERLEKNYTFYYGGLTEEEQMYRDYYESDLEEFPDNNFFNEHLDVDFIHQNKEFVMDKYNFTEEHTFIETRSPADSFVERMLFKHRYRNVSDINYHRRSERVAERSLKRAQNRDPNVVLNLGEKLAEISSSKGLCKKTSGLEDELLPFASYVAEEGLQQFKDYYETDIENGTINREILEDLSERDKIQFAECYLNELNKSLITDKSYVQIPKRLFNYKKSITANFVDDLIDFNIRVKPLARKLAFRDAASFYQPLPLNSSENKIFEEDETRYKPILNFKKSSKSLSSSEANKKL